MMKYGKREIAKIAEVLDGDYDSAEQAAVAALSAMEEIFVERAKFVVVGQVKNKRDDMAALGWFSTEGDAKSAAESLVWSLANPGEVFLTAVLPVVHMSAADYHRERRTARKKAETGKTQAERLSEQLSKVGLNAA